MSSPFNILFLLVFLVYVPVDGYYVALVPKTIRDSSRTVMVISNTARSGNEYYRLKYTNLQNGNVHREEKSVAPRTMQDIITSKPGALVSGMHSLQITNTNSGTTHETILTVDSNYLSILIQTDKPLYKPGDSIKFRVLILDELFKPPAKLKSISVKLHDSSSNLIRDWPYGKLEHGVFQSQIELANFVPLGNWTLAVTVLNGKTQEKNIPISEYVLPMHEIHVTCPKAATFSDDTLELLVDARYTFGKPIQGCLVLNISDVNVLIDADINGRAKISVELEQIVNSNAASYSDVYWLNVGVKIIEQQTDHTYEHKEQIPIFKQAHKFELRKSSEYMHPEVDFKCWLKLTDPLGNLIENPSTLSIKSIRGDLQDTKTMKPDKQGIVELKYPALGNTKSIKLEITYAGKVTHFSIESRVEDLNVVVLTDNPSPKQTVEVLVISSFDLDPLMYYVIARGEIITKGQVFGKANEKLTLRFLATLAMIPSASLALFAIRNNELVQSIVHFQVSGLENYVNVTLSDRVAEPGNNVTITVNTLPGAVVGLTAVDKSVLLLEGGNDITQQSLIDSIDTRSGDTIEDLGFNLLTNALIPKPYDNDWFGGPDLRVGLDVPEDQIRTNFPESWLWTDIAPVSSTGELIFNSTVPDTITSWSISAFATSAQHGIGFIRQPIELTVIKPFFVTVNTAYSILKTEAALIEVFVYNYLKESIQRADVYLIVDQSDFEIVDESGEILGSNQQTESLVLFDENISKLSFYLKPKRSGDLTLTVTAKTASNKMDGIRRTIKVLSGGLQYYKNIARLIEVSNSTQRFTNLELNVPRRATPGTENITFSVEGMLLVAALQNLGGLIRLPTGCGEQNMLNFVPSVIALEYMSISETLKESVKLKAIDYLNKGYQNQLRYQLRDGSFGVFQYEKHGSLFLTALVAKTFRIAGNHITVDDKIVKRAYDWIRDEQNWDGSFKEKGRVIYRQMQGGLSDGVTLTAYTLIAILEHKTIAYQYRNVVEKGINFIVNKLDNLERPFELAIVSYALHLANNPRKDGAFEKLLEFSSFDESKDTRCWVAGSMGIETTAYALLTFLNRKMYMDSLPVVRWLVSQRYDLGGYGNTQNTLLGLQALAEYSLKIPSAQQRDFQVEVFHEAGRSGPIRVDTKSSVVSQQLALPPEVRYVNVSISGTGLGTFGIQYRYNVKAFDDTPSFVLSKTIRTSRSYGVLDLNVCARFVPDENVDETQETNMVLMEVLLPSGYVIAGSSLRKLQNTKIVRKVETKRGDSQVILYFDPLSANKSVCVDVSALRKAVVLGQIAGMIKVYDYYDPSREAYEYYDAKPISHEV